MTNKIILAGLANNKTSLGEVFRRYVDCFRRFNNVDVFDLSEFIKNDEFKVDFFPKYTGPIDHDIKLIHATPSLYRSIKSTTTPKPRGNTRKIGYFVWESSEMSADDIPVLSDFDEIWTATSYCKDIFSKYIPSENIHIVPHPIPPPTQKYKKFDRFSILIIGNISSNVDRKNIEEAVRVGMVLKEKYPEVDVIFKTFTVSAKEKLILRNLIGNSQVRVIDEYFSTEDTQKLIAQSHIVLSMHRSEGFGMTLAEAMSVGTLPIATGYSGNTDFMKNKNTLIDYKLIDVQNPYFQGQWAQPNFDDAVDKISNLIENPKNLNTYTKGNAEFVRRYLSEKPIAKQIQTLCSA